MANPFPGMDPYMELDWKPVHTMLIAGIVDMIEPQLAADLAAKPEESILIDEHGETMYRRYPDVGVIEDPWIERHIEIVEAHSRRLITAIEILSPWNKLPGQGRDAFNRKRQQYQSAKVNIVEIDLIRAGNWVEMLRPWYVQPEHRTTYRASVKRANRLQIELYPIGLRQELPTIRIPLRESEPDATISLQPIVNQVHRRLRMEQTDYSQPCSPGLNADDAKWANEVLRAVGHI